MNNIDYGPDNLKDIAEKEQGNRQNPKRVGRTQADLTSQEHERALKGAYRNFVMFGVPKADIGRC